MLTVPSNHSYSGKSLGYDIYGIGVGGLPSVTFSVGGDGISDTFADFGFSGPGAGDGTWLTPHKTLGSALLATPAAGGVGIKAGSTSETLTIDQHITLRAIGGPVTIGN